MKYSTNAISPIFFSHWNSCIASFSPHRPPRILNYNIIFACKRISIISNSQDSMSIYCSTFLRIYNSLSIIFKYRLTCIKWNSNGTFQQSCFELHLVSWLYRIKIINLYSIKIKLHNFTLLNVTNIWVRKSFFNRVYRSIR